MASMRHSVVRADDPQVSPGLGTEETFLYCPPDGNRHVSGFLDSELYKEQLSSGNRTQGLCILTA